MTRPVGNPVEAGTALPPPRKSFKGRSVSLEPLSPVHIDGLWEIIGQPDQVGVWTYIPTEPLPGKAAFTELLSGFCKSQDPVFYALVDPSGNPLGFFSLMRIDLKTRVVELGYVIFSPLLQRTTAATEAFYLIASAVFGELGYRRLEWKCDNLNVPSKKAAARFGFTEEGVFRQHLIVKGRNRDTAWFSIVDTEWPRLQDSFDKWLDPANFDADGNQRCSLTSFRGA